MLTEPQIFEPTENGHASTHADRTPFQLRQVDSSSERFDKGLKLFDLHLCRLPFYLFTNSPTCEYPPSVNLPELGVTDQR